MDTLHCIKVVFKDDVALYWHADTSSLVGDVRHSALLGGAVAYTATISCCAASALKAMSHIAAVVQTFSSVDRMAGGSSLNFAVGPALEGIPVDHDVQFKQL